MSSTTPSKSASPTCEPGPASPLSTHLPRARSTLMPITLPSHSEVASAPAARPSQTPRTLRPPLALCHLPAAPPPARALPQAGARPPHARVLPRPLRLWGRRQAAAGLAGRARAVAQVGCEEGVQGERRASLGVGRCWAWASGIGRRATVARRRCLLAVELLLFARVQKFAPALLLLFAHLPRASSLMGRARAVGAGSGAREQFAALSPARAASVPARAPAAAARRNASLRCRLRLAAAQA